MTATEAHHTHRKAANEAADKYINEVLMPKIVEASKLKEAGLQYVQIYPSQWIWLKHTDIKAKLKALGYQIGSPNYSGFVEVTWRPRVFHWGLVYILVAISVILIVFAPIIVSFLITRPL